MKKEIRLEMLNIVKAFSGVLAVKGVTLTVAKGEVMALLGENGAGKSTIMKVLSGMYGVGSYEGEIKIDGNLVRSHSPQEAARAGVAMIYQELNPFLDMTVAENVFMHDFPVKNGMVDVKKMNGETRKLIEAIGVDIHPNMRLRSLPAGQQQIVAILRELHIDAKVFIFDEPTSSLTKTETVKLFEIIRRLKSQGKSIIYISHRLDEVFQIADTVSVMRDGYLSGEMELDHGNSEAQMKQIISWMVGRDVKDMYPVNHAEKGEVSLSVQNLTIYDPLSGDKKIIDNISFTIRKGEIVGLAGLVGAGRTEILSTIFGCYKGVSHGTILLDGKVLEIHSPREAIRENIALLTEDRRANGIIAQMSVEENITVPIWRRIARHGVMNRKQELDIARKSIQDLLIKCHSGKMRIDNLSGGNQQKAVLAKWLNTEPRLLLLDEPTRGVDIGAKVEIYQIMNRLVEQGMTILWASSELPELMEISDRILVLGNGHICGDYKNGEISQEAVLALASGAGGE